MVLSGVRLRSASMLAALLMLACGSDPLEAGGDGEGGGPPSDEPGGTGGDGGAGARPPEDIPDYSASPCYGRSVTTLRYDGQTHETTDVAATCRGEGDRTLLYVAEDLFGTLVTQDTVNRFLYRYEKRGNEESYRPDLGVFATDEEVFGPLPPSQTTGGKMPIFIIDSQDGGDGYLCGWCGRPELHLDGVNLAPLDGDEALSIAAHESFHAIHRGYDADESTWVDETLAEAAMVVNGFSDPAWLESFLERPNVNWGPAITDFTDYHYGAGLVYGAYLWEQGGAALMRAITSEPKNDWAGIDAALAATGSARDGFAMFLDMAVALYVDDPARGYGFETLDFGGVLEVSPLTSGAATDGTLQPYGLVYLELPAGASTLTVRGGTSVRARVVVDRQPLEVRAVELGAETPLEDAPTVLILSATAKAPYSVTAR